MKYSISIFLLTLFTLTTTGCGEDKCDPTGFFGCQQYTKHYNAEIDNQTAETLEVKFNACRCCRTETNSWTVPANKKTSKEIKFVDYGGGDACDEGAANVFLGIKIAGEEDWIFTKSFALFDDLSGTCNEDGCNFGELPEH